MKKNIVNISTILIIISLILSGCGRKESNADELEGYWMNEYGGSVTFMGDGSAMWYGRGLSYTIYDGDKVILKDGSEQVGNFSFSVKSETLTLKDLQNGVAITLYGSEKKQKQIQDDLRAAEDKRIEQERQKEEQRVDEAIAAEWSAEVASLASYQDQLRKLDATAYTEEISNAQERIDILKTADRKKIEKDTFAVTKNVIRQYVLPEDVANSSKTKILDDGYINISGDPEYILIAYCVEVRMDNGDTAPIYGYYAVQFSSNTIYTIDLASDFWYPVE